ncbi:hypothetical protein [Persephonella sp.]
MLNSKHDFHTGHGKPKSILTLKYQYDIRNLRPQCMRCNVWLGGQTDVFIAKLENEKEGLEFLQEACIKTNEGWKVKTRNYIKNPREFLEGKIKEYKELLNKYSI